MSPELAQLARLRLPEKVRPGDMWHIKRLGIVWLVLGHNRSSSTFTYISLYHFARPSLRARPADLRDNDANAGRGFDPHRTAGEDEYLGNLFEMLPYESLAATRARGQS